MAGISDGGGEMGRRVATRTRMPFARINFRHLFDKGTTLLILAPLTNNSQESARTQRPAPFGIESMHDITFSPNLYASILFPVNSNRQHSGHVVSMNMGNCDVHWPVPHESTRLFLHVKHGPVDALSERKPIR
jgi:hypothetical protein